MSLQKWLKNYSQLLLPTRRRRSLRRSPRRAAPRWQSAGHFVPASHETLEDRVLPASISWVGDVNTSWSANIGSDTNWSADSLPLDGESLSFIGNATGTLTNDTTANNSYSLTFASGGYTITGNSIRLDNTETDIIQISGPNLLQAPLQLDASSIEVQSGVLDLAGNLTGTAGLTKLGSGTRVLTGPASFTGGTVVQAGTLQVDGNYSSADPISIDASAILAGDGAIAGNVSLAGLLNPGQLTGTTAPIGDLQVGSLNMTSTSKLTIQIAGSSTSQFDRLTVTGNAALDGTLAIELASGYTPTAGTIFQVLSADSTSGQFTNWTGLGYTGGVLLPIQTPAGLLLVATPFPAGAVSLLADTHTAGQALANFFAGTTDTVAVSGSIQILNQTLAGNLAFTRRAASANGQALTIISASDVSLQLNGSDTNLVSITNGSGVLVLSQSGLAADLSVTVAESIDNVSFAGTFGLAINSTGLPVSETVTVGGSSRTISLPAGPYVRLTADNTTLTTAVFNVSGNFTLETTGTGSSREILVGATGVYGFLGDDGGTTADSTDDVGVQLTGGTLLAVVAASGSLALSSSGTLSLVGLPQLSLDGTASLEINTTSSRITRSMNVGGVNRTLNVAANLERLALRNVLATFSDFVELSGDFSVERTVSDSTTTLQLAASNVGAFLGVQRGQADEFGVRVANASAALVIEKTTGSAPKFAARTNAGTVSIPGLPDLDLSGPTALEINRLGRSINLDIPDLDGVDIPLQFAAADLVNRFGGNLTLDIDGFTSLSGTFAFEKQNDGGTTEIRVAATSVSTFLGRNHDGILGNSDDV
ncbi:MAG: Hemolysin, chromosomal, partial [Planctomycetota bacterium]